VNGSVVEVAGTVGGLASVGLVGREGERRDGTAVGAPSIRGDPRRTILQRIDVLLGERAALLIGLADGWPRVVELTSGCEVASDSHESADEGGEGNDTEEGERRRVGNHSDEEAWKVGTSKNTYVKRERVGGMEDKQDHIPATAVEVKMRRSPGPQISQWDLPKSTGRARRT